MTPLPLSLNLATVRRQWGLPQAVEAAARHGFAGVAPWRDMVRETGVAESARIFRDNGLRVTGFCRGGLFGAAGRDNLQAADRRQPAHDRRGGGDRRRGHRGDRRRACAGLARSGRSPRDVRRGACGGRSPCARLRGAARAGAAASDVRGGPRLHHHAQGDARRGRRRRRCQPRHRRRHLSRMVGPGACRANRPRRPAASSRITSATGWCRPATCSTTAA